MSQPEVTVEAYRAVSAHPNVKGRPDEDAWVLSDAEVEQILVLAQACIDKYTVNWDWGRAGAESAWRSAIYMTSDFIAFRREHGGALATDTLGSRMQVYTSQLPIEVRMILDSYSSAGASRVQVGHLVRSNRAR